MLMPSRAKWLWLVLVVTVGCQDCSEHMDEEATETYEAHSPDSNSP